MNTKRKEVFAMVFTPAVTHSKKDLLSGSLYRGYEKLTSDESFIGQRKLLSVKPVTGLALTYNMTR